MRSTTRPVVLNGLSGCDEAVQTAPRPMRAVIAALQALRGIALVSAVTIVTEVGRLSRFGKPRQLMGYSGTVPSEDSSGPRIRRFAITKTGNAHRHPAEKRCHHVILIILHTTTAATA